MAKTPSARKTPLRASFTVESANTMPLRHAEPIRNENNHSSIRWKTSDSLRMRIAPRAQAVATVSPVPNRMARTVRITEQTRRWRGRHPDNISFDMIQASRARFSNQLHPPQRRVQLEIVRPQIILLHHHISDPTNLQLRRCSPPQTYRGAQRGLLGCLRKCRPFTTSIHALQFHGRLITFVRCLDGHGVSRLYTSEIDSNKH